MAGDDRQQDKTPWQWLPDLRGPGVIWQRRRTSVYVLRSLTRQVLYVGITSRSPAQRWAEHARDKPWWHEVAFKQVEGSYRSIAAAKRREIKLIRRLNPRYNLEHNNLANVPAWYLRSRRQRRRSPIIDFASFWGPIMLAAVLAASRGPSDALSLFADVLAVVLILWPQRR